MGRREEIFALLIGMSLLLDLTHNPIVKLGAMLCAVLLVGGLLCAMF